MKITTLNHLMHVLRLEDAKYKQGSTGSWWFWPKNNVCMGNTRGYTFVSAITVNHPSTEHYFKVQGDYTPKELWHALSLALLEHDIICEPLQQDMTLTLPLSESMPCSF